MTLQGLQHSRIARRWFGVLVVVVLGCKALIPTGYMWAAVDGHSQLVMCPAGLYRTSPVSPLAGMGHMPGMNHSAHGVLGAGQCPFAIAGGAGLVAVAHELTVPHFVVLQPARTVALVSVPIAPPLRHHAPRGPPSLA